jgi:thiamine-phosphate pyrophosphorylase
MQSKILRIIDANANRATEGLRVAEDIVRFVLDDEKLTSRLKHIRHEIMELLRDVTRLRQGFGGQGWEMRDVKGDVGAKRTSKSEAKRADILDVFMANIKRAEESVRVFEETSKLFDPKLGPKFKKIRFALYEIEQQAAVKLKKNIKLDSPIYIITDDSFGHSHLEIMREAAKAGAAIFQYRDKRQGARGKLKTARKLAAYAKAHGLTFIVNDDIDIARKVDADGVHLGFRDARREMRSARKMLGNDKIIGISASNLKEAVKAEAMGADYVGFGPVFKTPIKPNAKPTGIKELKQVTKRVTIPVVAIGGVCARTIGQVMASGAASGAVIRYVSAAENIRKAVRRLLLLSRRPR